jgi:bile acid-coenzyme A ligase
MAELVSYGRKISLLAEEHPEKTAIVFVPVEGDERLVSWRELDRRSNQIARLMAERGVNETSLAAIGLPNSPEHIFATYGAWKLGALVLPMRAALPQRERDAILEVGTPGIVVADWDEVAWPLLTSADLDASKGYDDGSLPDRIPHPGKAIGSGGSTGRPKIIVDPRPWAGVPNEFIERARSGFRPRQTQLVAGPLYHNSPFSWSNFGLFYDQLIVLMERFNAERALELIERYRVNWAFTPPTMLRRMYLVPEVHTRDLSSVERIFLTAAPCPPWLKRFWIERLGPTKVYEAFGSSEAVGHCDILGDEWLEHPGSVGKPQNTDMKLLDEDGNEVPTGEVGEIFMRRRDTDEAPYYYIGSPPAKSTPDGFTSVGDMGWVDAEGYLFLADRRTDLIITGGANVYPAEVEAALIEHSDVYDVAVIGVPDEDWGKRVHAIIQPQDITHPPELVAIHAHVRDRIASYKVPKTYEFVALLPRDDAGKIRRSALAADRESGWTENMVRP